MQDLIFNYNSLSSNLLKFYNFIKFINYIYYIN